MPKRKPSGKPSDKKPARHRDWTLRRLTGEAFELAPPAGAPKREEDLEEVRAMLAAGETEVAVEELRWLLSGCDALLEAHRLLGEIALAESHFDLARAHFGRAFEFGLDAMGTRFAGRLPADRPVNRPFFLAGKGLAWALKQLGETALAVEVVDRLRRLDPADPLQLANLLTATEYP